MIAHTLGQVNGLKEVAENIFVLSFTSKIISSTIRPGQFLNIKVAGGTDPLLRRPFSVYRTQGDQVELIFNVVGKGTSAMHAMRPGDELDILGPLGTPYSVDEEGFETAILVGGGLGVAPFPITTEALKERGKSIMTFLGARSAPQVVEAHLVDVHIATDDGSRGYRGTVVDLLAEFMKKKPGPCPQGVCLWADANAEGPGALHVGPEAPL